MAQRDRRLTSRLHRRGPAPDLRDRRDQLTERVVTGMVRQIPAYAHAPPAFRDVVAEVVGRLVEQVLQLFVEQRHATRREVADLVELCIPPVEAGVTLEDMLQVFRIAQDVLWWVLHDLVDTRTLTDDAMALELGHLGTSFITDLANGVSSAYVRGDRVWLARTDAERALVRALLDTPPRVDEATRAAHALDLRVQGSWQVAVYVPLQATDGSRRGEDTPSGAAPPAEAPAIEVALGTIDRHLETELGRHDREGARWLTGTRVVLALQVGATLPPPPPGARAGSGGRHEGANGMRQSHDEAMEALDVATARGLASCTIEQARLDRVVLGTLTAGQLADELLAPLDAQPAARREMLTTTLETWLDEQGNATSTARRLQLHPQSARYRVEQLRALLGDALDDAELRLQLHLAVKARRLTSARGARPT